MTRKLHGLKLVDFRILHAPPIRGRFAISPSGCLLFTGTLHPKGYGRACGTTAHRVAYEMVIGPIPEGKQLDHLCRVRRCINPFHCEPVTSRENTARGINHVAVFMRATHCIHGHEFTEENTRRFQLRNGRMGRACRECERIKGQRYREAKRLQKERVA